MQRKLGIIAFTDILGYSELMKNNDVGEQLESVLKLIYEIPDRISPFINTLFDGRTSIDKEIIDMTNRIENLVVSDSILTMLEIKDYGDDVVNGFQWILFGFYMSYMQKGFLDDGFPLRGAISYGEYITIKNSFAGTPIIEAYELGNSLNSIGIMLSEKAKNDILKYAEKDPEFFKDMLIMSSFDYRDKKQNKNLGVFISPIFPYDKAEREKYSSHDDLIIYMTSAFTAHSKKLNDQGEQKLKNSIELYSQIFSD